MTDRAQTEPAVALPKVDLRIVEDLTPPGQTGFLRLIRRKLVAVDAHGHQSAPFIYDEVDRTCIDAVVVAAHYQLAGVRHVYLRSSARPPAQLRSSQREIGPSHICHDGLWELCAGLVEPEEASEPGIVECAKRELKEELGFDVGTHEMLPLGPSTYPCPGVIAERHYFFHVEVNPEQQAVPTLDGSPLEQLGAVIDVTLEQALNWCRTGQLKDAKSELGLRRLAELPITHR